MNELEPLSVLDIEDLLDFLDSEISMDDRLEWRELRIGLLELLAWKATHPNHEIVLHRTTTETLQ
jgi:hypothetical protein